MRYEVQVFDMGAYDLIYIYDNYANQLSHVVFDTLQKAEYACHQLNEAFEGWSADQDGESYQYE